MHIRCFWLIITHTQHTHQNTRTKQTPMHTQNIYSPKSTKNYTPLKINNDSTLLIRFLKMAIIEWLNSVEAYAKTWICTIFLWHLIANKKDNIIYTECTKKTFLGILRILIHRKVWKMFDWCIRKVAYLFCKSILMNVWKS